MIDYILSFPNEATAHTTLADWRGSDENGDGFWMPKPKCGIMEITIINQEAIWDNTDPKVLALVTPEIQANGFWMTISMIDIDNDLWAKPYTLSEHDHSLSATRPTHLLRTKLTPDQIAGVGSYPPSFCRGHNIRFRVSNI